LARSSPRRPPHATPHRSARRAAVAGLVVLAGACTQTLDAGHNGPHGPLPVDERNPVILSQDDWSGDWLGEYAALFANSGGPPLVGIIVNGTPYWPNVGVNAAGWKELVSAAKMSGLENIPDVTPSDGKPLVRPASGVVEMTAANNSLGAQLIVNLSRQLSTPSRPIVIASATRLTDIADAYLMDHTVVDRVVVVAALGSVVPPNGVMDGPNGDMDAWADWIVAQRFRYVHVGTWYDQTGDVTAAQLSSLPKNPLGMRIMDKQPNIITDFLTASDQVALLATALPGFVTGVQRASPDTSAPFDSAQGPPLVPDDGGNVWVVTAIAGPLAQARLWQMLLDPQIFGP